MTRPRPDALTPLLRAYIRWAPWRLGKRALWARVAAGRARRPRPFVARTAYGFRVAGDQRLIMPRCLYWFGLWEPALSAWIQRSLRPGDVFVDVGANLGYFSLLAARAVTDSGSVVAIEASPENARRLEENLERNNVRNVRIIRAAAAAEAGAVRLYRAPWNDAEDSIVPNGGKDAAVDVPAGTLASLLSDDELGRARVIKIDVEGGELGVLRGLAPVAAQLRADAEIAVEAHPDVLAAQGAGVSDLLGLLRPAGFGARELPVDISELAHLEAAHPDPAPLRGDADGLVHLIFSRAR
jgi:FkbM family methyltransferase